jgi:hypothetical protein
MLHKDESRLYKRIKNFIIQNCIKYNHNFVQYNCSEDGIERTNATIGPLKGAKGR